ncbi:FkbM family methyltransferase [Candidatus Bathyarchaeota archaeon]|nr:FkbM family methyltransferase [Candidatus Bathyarchaeota archaeon]
MSLLERLKVEFSKKAPNWLYALTKSIYRVLHRREVLILIPSTKGYWISLKRGGRLYTPSPKGDWTSFIIKLDRASLIREGDVVVEAGACIGATVLSIAHKAGKVVAVEPDPLNLKFLCWNVKSHGLNNVIIVGKALWSVRTKLKLHLASTVTGPTVTPYVFSYTAKPLTGKYVEVEADTLDNILAELDVEKVDLLMMNIEGAELEALRGAEKTLRKTSKLRIDCHNERIKEEIRRILKERGFIVKLEEDYVHAKRGQ